MADKPHYIHQPEAFWTIHVDGWKSTTLTQAEYCRVHNLPKSSFSRWKKRLEATKGRKTKRKRRVLEATPKYNYYCSYCGKKAIQARRLIPGYPVSICIDCLENAGRAYNKWYLAEGGHLKCIFCKRNESKVKHLVGDDLHYICDECVEQCRSLLREIKP